MPVCAIAGVIRWDGWEPDEEGLPDAMAQGRTYRRGPARLEVADPEGTGQPILLPARGGMAVVYDGELHNARELRGELAALGHRFEGRSGAETAAHAYAEWGADCVKRFDGIFALAVWEEEGRRLFLARDRMGMKPLLFTLAGERLCFASGVETLPRFPGCGALQDVRELESACCAYFSKAGWRTWRYRAPADRP